MSLLMNMELSEVKNPNFILIKLFKKHKSQKEDQIKKLNPNQKKI